MKICNTLDYYYLLLLLFLPEEGTEIFVCIDNYSVKRFLNSSSSTVIKLYHVCNQKHIYIFQ